MKKQTFVLMSSLLMLTNFTHAVIFKNDSSKTVTIGVTPIEGNMQLGKVVGAYQRIVVKPNTSYTVDADLLDIEPIAKISCLPCCFRVNFKATTPYLRLTNNTVITLDKNLKATRTDEAQV